MGRTRTSSSREQKATLQLCEALGSSLDIRLVLKRAYPLLVQLVPADYGALGISSSGRPEDYEWIAEDIPPAFFAAYPEMAQHDFVRTSVTTQLNVVLRDDDMVSRPELEGNMMYRRAREVGAPLEHVMAVMLHVDERWQSGLSLYRDKRRPFSERERASLQGVTQMLANTVRNCHVHSAAADRSAALDALCDDRGESVVLVARSGTEVARTDGAAKLIEKWFTTHERRAGRLPDPLAAVLAQVASSPLAQGAPLRWTRERVETTLDVSFLPLPPCVGMASWMLRLREVSHGIPIPHPWLTLLTPTEQKVTAGILRGWTNRLIADDLKHRTEETARKHVWNIFNKLGVSSRAALIARAVEIGRPL